MKRTVPLLLVLACLLTATATGAILSDPAQIMNEAYIHLVQGDQSMDAGRHEEALALYRQAREYYQRLSREFPGFEPRIIQYRMTYCDNQIAGIERRQDLMAGRLAAPSTPARIPPPPAPALAPAVQSSAPAMPAPTDRSVEIDFLRSRINSLEAELSEFDRVQDELDALTQQNRQLRQELATAQQELNSRAGGDEQIEALRSELAARDAQILSMSQELDAKRALDQALNDMEARVNELRTTAERLNQEIRTLDEELDAAEVRAEEAEGRARRAEQQWAEAQGRAAMAEQDLASVPPGDLARDRSPQRAPIRPDRQPDSSPPPPPAVPPTQPAAPAAPAPAAAPLPIPDGMTAAAFVRQLLQEGRNPEALATVQNARRAATGDMNLALIEGIALIRMQRYDPAATLLIDLARRNPSNPEIHATLGAAMMGAGFFDEARETLQKAVRLDRNLAESHYNLAQLYAFIEPVNLRLARRHYRNARDLGLSPDPQLEQALN